MYPKILVVLFAAAPFLATATRGDEAAPSSHYAAIAYSPTTKLIGSAFSTASADEAQRLAISNCKFPDAVVVVSVSNGWCCLAMGKNNIHAGAWGGTQAEVQQKALAACSNLTTGSYIVVSLFSGTDTEPRLRREPPTPMEEKMFQRMYGEAGLDADTLQTLQESWATATRRDRKAQYHNFMAKIKEAVDAVTPVNIRIANPAEYQVPWSYLINGEPQNLPSGYTQDLTRRSTIKFDRGGEAGPAEYRLDEGVYNFTRDENGKWDLLRQASDLAAEEKGREPITDAEAKMFQEMYGQVELDAETLQAVKDGWAGASSADRKAQYERFMAKIKEAVDAVTPVNIRIANPAKNEVAWTYLLDGKSQTLAAGSVQDLQKKATIKFDRGEGKGSAEYALGEGTYTFGPADGGGWELFHTTAADQAAGGADPVTAEQEKMFQEMYGQVDLDADTLKAVKDGWTSASSADRKAQYERFMAKVQEAVDAVTPVNIRIANPAKNAVAWTYLLDGKSRTLAAGATDDLQKKATIKFDRGEGKGSAEYTLIDGTYTFGPADGGGWELFHTAAVGQAAGGSGAGPADPVTAKDWKMFREMYGQIGLDAETFKTLKGGWTSASSAERKAQYEQFMAKVREAVAAAEKKARASK